MRRTPVNIANRIEQRRSVPPILYHYTNAAGVRGILSSRAQWATHFSCLEDTSEYTYAKHMALEKLRDLRSRYFLAPYAEELDSTAAKLEALDPQLFVVSFCPHGNQLNQWRSYGEPNDAYAIGFSGRSLWALTRRRDPRYRTLRLAPVVYDSASQLALLDAVEYDAGVYQERSGKEYAAEYIARFVRSAAFIKHYDFYQEEEWRLAAHIHHRISSTVKSRRRGSTNVRYVAVHFPRASIVEVVMGPSMAAPVLSREDLLALRQKCGLQFKVSVSETPYRPMK